MEDIDKARAIRDAILAHENAEFGTVTFGGGEHPAWLVNGPGWQGSLSNGWDMYVAGRRDAADALSERRELLDHEHLRVMVGADTVMHFFYEEGGGPERLVFYDPGPWEEAFRLTRSTVAAAQLRRAA